MSQSLQEWAELHGYPVGSEKQAETQEEKKLKRKDARQLKKLVALSQVWKHEKQSDAPFIFTPAPAATKNAPR